MKLYIKRKPSTSPLGITTKKSDTLTFKTDMGEEHFDATRVSSLKGKDIPDEYELPVDNTGKFIVWKKEYVDNPYYNDGKTEPKEIPDMWIQHTDFLRKEKTISRQMFAELKFNQPKGFFTEERSWTNPTAEKKAAKTYLETIRRKFNDTNIFDDEFGMSPMQDYIWINSIQRCIDEYALRGSKFAADLEAVQKYKSAEYYIHDSSKESELKHKVARPKIDSYAALQQILDKYGDEDLLALVTLVQHYYNQLVLFDRDSSKDAMQNWLSEFIMGEANDQRKRHLDFLEVYKRYSTPVGKKELQHEYFIIKCIKFGVLKKDRINEQYKYYLEGQWVPLMTLTGLRNMTEKENKETLDILREQLKEKGK